MKTLGCGVRKKEQPGRFDNVFGSVAASLLSPAIGAHLSLPWMDETMCSKIMHKIHI